MIVEHVIIALVLILGLSLLAQPLARWSRLPFASLLVLLGYFVSEAVVFAGVDTGLRADNFQSIIFYVFIPVLVFESAYTIDKQQLKSNLPVILSLAIIAMLSTCLLTAVFLFYGIDHATGFPWLAALITGAILAATDPVAVVTKLREMKAPKRITVLLEGESLFNDATAIVLFGLFLSMAMSMENVTASQDAFSVPDIAMRFLIVFIGGAIVGAAIGLFFGYLKKIISHSVNVGVLSLLVAYGSFLLAEFFHVSGVMSTLLAALCYSAINQNRDDSKNMHLWDVFAYIANASVFLIMGAVITMQMFEQRWLAMLVAIGALLLARIISIYGVLFLFRFSEKTKVNMEEQTVMVWGGLRGAVTLALALSLPITLEYWWTIQSIAFGVVMFSLFVQAPSMHLLANKLIVRD